MKYVTFENRIVDTSDMDHQHLSNIYWHQKVIFSRDCHVSILEQIQKKYNGIILPYKPNPNFKLEIDTLDDMGILVWKNVNGIGIADIIFGGEKIGEACYTCYTVENRKILIDKIIKNE